MELLAAQIADGGVANLVEVVGQHLRRQTHGDALCALCQQQRKLHGQRDGFLVAAVVGHLPFGGLRVEHHVEGKLRQASLDVSWGGGARSRQDVAPVALRVDEQFLLAQLHQGVADTGVAVRVELHRVSHDVGHLVVAPVVHTLHRVQDAALHGLEAVLDVRNGAIQYGVGGIVQKPVLVHTAQVVHGSSVETIHGPIVRVLVLVQQFVVFSILVHRSFFEIIMQKYIKKVRKRLRKTIFSQ